MNKIWIINGYTSNVGQWILEIFTDKDDAIEAFNSYVNEYEATKQRSRNFTRLAFCSDGKFWIEEHSL